MFSQISSLLVSSACGHSIRNLRRNSVGDTTVRGCTKHLPVLSGHLETTVSHPLPGRPRGHRRPHQKNVGPPEHPKKSARITAVLLMDKIRCAFSRFPFLMDKIRCSFSRFPFFPDCHILFFVLFCVLAGDQPPHAAPAGLRDGHHVRPEDEPAGDGGGGLAPERHRGRHLRRGRRGGVRPPRRTDRAGGFLGFWAIFCGPLLLVVSVVGRECRVLLLLLSPL